MMLASLLPLPSERLDMRAQWLIRLLKHPRFDPGNVLEPFAREVLREVSANGQVIILSLDQTDLGDRHAVLMVSVQVGNRGLPLVWWVEEGEANIGFEPQRALLERVRGWLPEGAGVLLLADRFYPSEGLLTWVKQAQWGYRLRLKGNLTVDVGQGGIETVGDLAVGVTERYTPQAQLFAAGITTNIGVLHEAGHPEPWIIAIDCKPTKAAVQDYGLRWGIEPMFSDFKSRGFGLEDTQLHHAERVERLIAIMALAMYWCVRTGGQEARQNPVVLKK